MNELIKKHYAATWGRGLISESTTMSQFIDKIGEEYEEMLNAYADGVLENEPLPTGELIHESIDLVAVIFNMLHFYGVNVDREFRKNISYQESRI